MGEVWKLESNLVTKQYSDRSTSENIYLLVERANIM